MADISLCKGTDCLRKDSCLRHTQEPLLKYQSWLVMQVSIKEVDKCRFFINNEENKLDEQS